MVLSQGEWDFGKYFYFILFLGGNIFNIPSTQFSHV